MNKRILIVEDNDGHREMLQEILLYSGFDVKALSDGNELFASIVIFKPDLIVLDYMLPGKDGIELCRMIKSKNISSSLPVILISAYVGVLQYFSCCDSVMCKPLDLYILISKINELLLIERVVV